ncbi:hypothetical protein AHFPHNDE_03898 [Pseudomonas sp. MM227]|uniref:DUF3010 family protein n=1 Tax=Pseudomonas sp. MM227 TaxID=3019968 RepID=UPI002220008A|nr:DUF3010 family protein [Pseudomonas sp. MM227]CAI3790179.1 hypothetical protein AHFPHNDE_03898 [Pseudomonas sp. MM227]
MKIVGVEIKGSEAIFAVVEYDGADLAHLPTSLKKIALEDDDIAANVRQFREQVAAFVGDNGLKMLAIKKRGKKGEFAGGPTTFKIEGVLQLLEGCEAVLVSPQTISAQAKKLAELPGSLNKYQHEAYKAACAVLLKAR